MMTCGHCLKGLALHVVPVDIILDMMIFGHFRKGLALLLEII